MSGEARHDAWSAGDAYEAYMGRWSRPVAAKFLDWLDAPSGLHWLDVGCGTGALSAAVLSRHDPASLVGVDPSQGFIDHARRAIGDARARFRVGDAQALPLPDGDRDWIVSALMLNFVPDRAKALAEMRRVTRPEGRIAFYVWDYPGGGVELMDAFWNAAIALDPRAADLEEGRRFPFCTADGLRRLATAAGLAGVCVEALDVPTVFRDFQDYWHPFTLGAGPAPGYCMSLPEPARQQLREHLEASLPRAGDGKIPLKARAWAVQGHVSAAR